MLIKHVKLSYRKSNEHNFSKPKLNRFSLQIFKIINSLNLLIFGNTIILKESELGFQKQKWLDSQL